MIRLIQWGNYRPAIIAEGNAIVSLDDDVYSLYPEFLNRIDDIVIFDRIKQDDMQQIVDVQLPALARHIEASKNIIDGSIKQGCEVIVKYDNNKYSFDTKQRVTLW